MVVLGAILAALLYVAVLHLISERRQREYFAAKLRGEAVEYVIVRLVVNSIIFGIIFLFLVK